MIYLHELKTHNLSVSLFKAPLFFVLQYELYKLCSLHDVFTSRQMETKRYIVDCDNVSKSKKIIRK